MRTHRTLLATVALATVFSAGPPFDFWMPIQKSLAGADVPLPSIPKVGHVSNFRREASGRAWTPRQTPVVDVVKNVKNAVVNIHSERTVRAPGDNFLSLTPSQNRVNGMGTGIVIDPRGYIVTNQHVVEDVSLLRVRLVDGTVVGARVLARDIESDLALLKITPPRPLAVMPLGTTKDLQVGETVVAIGNAYGYDHTVTVGAVSAIGRDVSLNKDIRYRALIQTDASINPGNSGGPLLNLDGELVGVNVAIRAGAQGIGFAIPVDAMIRSAGGMLAQVRQSAGVASVGMELRDEVVSTASSRRVILEHSEAAAAKAGLRKGDVLIKVNDQVVHSSLDVERALLEREAGAHVEFVVLRETRKSGAGPTFEQRKLNVVLETAPRDALPRAALASGRSAGASAQVWRQLGVRLAPMSNPVEVTSAFPQLHGGLVINDIRSGSPAAAAGLRNGDILVGLHQWEMLTLDNVLYVLNHADRHTFTPLRFYIVRGNQIHRGWLSVAD